MTVADKLREAIDSDSELTGFLAVLLVVILGAGAFSGYIVLVIVAFEWHWPVGVVAIVAPLYGLYRFVTREFEGAA